MENIKGLKKGAVSTGEDTRTGKQGAAIALLLIFVPVAGIGGTALISSIKGFSFQAVIINTFIAAAVCIISEIPLSKVTLNSYGSFYLVLSFCLGLSFVFISPFTFESILPLAAPAVLIGMMLGEAAGFSALVLFTSLSTLLLYESGLYFFYLFISGYALVAFFSRHPSRKALPAVITYLSLGAIIYYACIYISGAAITPGIVVFPAVGAFFNILIILIMKRKIIENVLEREEKFVLSLLDTEYELMQTLKKTERREYDLAVHTAHLCDILAERLSFDPRKTQGISFYSRIGILRGKQDIGVKSLSILREHNFPDYVIDGVKELYGYGGLRLSKESGSVFIVHRLLKDIYAYFDENKGESPDYSGMIISILKEELQDNRIKQSDLSLYDLGVISEVLRDKGFYYDFILKE